MKQSTTYNIVIFACLASFIATSLLVSKTQQEFDVVEAMNEKIKATKATTDGTPCRYKSVFEFDEQGTLLKKVEKVYFTDYRRTPERQESTLVVGVQPAKVVEATHNVSESSMVLVERQPGSDKKLSTQTISFDRA